jgi:hypothetical protein
MIDANQEVLSASPHRSRRRHAALSSARPAKTTLATPKKALNVERVFSDPKVDPFDQIEWEQRTAEITDDAGKVVFKKENVVAAGDQSGGVEIFLWRARHARARDVGPAIDPSDLPHHRRLGDQRRLFYQGRR